jgi:hypothetical protein
MRKQRVVFERLVPRSTLAFVESGKAAGREERPSRTSD